MPTLNINRDRRALLNQVADGKVYRSMGGCDLLQVRAGQNQRVERRLRELTGASLVELGPDGRHYQLTAAGELAKDAA